MIRCVRCLSVIAAMLMLVACSNSPEQYVLPDNVMDFATLYKGNCAGCHGQNGRYGAARPLHDGLYLALVGKERLRNVIANGVPGTTMPPFAQDQGGTLTDQQITTLADEMEKRWARPKEFDADAMPSYAAPLGNANAGAVAFRQYCASCHGPDGTGVAGKKAGSAVDPAYLDLVSDQYLRTTVIAGRSDEAIPNWRTYVPGQAMTPQEVSDVVAWLAAHRTFPGNRTKGGSNIP
jgi:cytochrome c oxidase cbb3-type subunit III